MTREQLELVLAREGLTRPQAAAVLGAADAYATAQARLAIGAFGFVPPSVVHLQAPRRVPPPDPAQLLLAQIRAIQEGQRP